MPKRHIRFDTFSHVPAHEVDTTTEVARDGLRYVSKVNGTPFCSGTTSGMAKSCIFCGKHRMPTHLTRRRVSGRLFEFCFDGCEKTPPSFRHPSQTTVTAEKVPA